ncbi:MAG: GAF domain-containing protein [Planctomycetota bacterium]
MQTPVLPVDEAERLDVLRTALALDTDPEPRFDRITRLLASQLEVPIALVSLIDSERQWFKSAVGLTVRETERRVSFCAHALESVRACEWLVVPDAAVDPRFADNPLVLGEPGIRSYAGAPIVVDGHCLGTLCAMDRQPRTFEPKQLELLAELAEVVADELQLRVSSARFDQRSRSLAEHSAELEQFGRVLVHDMAAPLRQIRMCVDSLEGDDELVTADEALVRIRNCVVVSSKLLVGLRSQLLSGFEPTIEPDALRDGVDMALAMQDPTLAQAGASVHVGELGEVRGNTAVLATVVQNLLANSCKHRSERPLEITIGAECEGPVCTVSVADNGMGIPAEQREAVFGFSVRLDEASEMAGSGIGLASSRRLLSSIGGKIWIEDAEVGTSVHFAFPIRA